MRTRPARLAAALLSVALLAAACGGDNDDDTAPASTTPTPETTAAPATTDAPVTTEAPSTPTLGGEPMSAEDAAAVDAAAENFLGGAGFNGVTAFYVAVSDPEKGDYVQAYGDAGLGGPAATVDDSFRIGSITKSVTATVILRLVEDGQLALDDTVEDLLPDRAVDYPELATLTVEQLLSMQTGLADYLNVPDGVVADIVADPTRVWGAEELVMAGVEATVDPPGTPGYSTTNYIVLQLIAESLTGTPLEELIEQEVTGPLGLDRMFLPPVDDTALPEPLTRGYIAGGCVEELAKDGATVDDGTDATDWSASYGQGGGGMTSDIVSLHGWAASLSGSSLLGDELAEARLEFTEIEPNLPYGLGMIQAGTWIGHWGEAIGWEALAMHDPGTGVSIAIAANGCGGLIVGFADFLDELYPEGGVYDALSGAGDASTSSVPDSTDPPTDESTSGTEPEVEVPVGEASGTMTFTAASATIEGEIVECALAAPDVDFVANGENAAVEVYSIGGGEVGVIVSGMTEWEGRGQATVSGGSVSIVGIGSPQGAGTQNEDFTIEAEIASC